MASSCTAAFFGRTLAWYATGSAATPGVLGKVVVNRSSAIVPVIFVRYTYK